MNKIKEKFISFYTNIKEKIYSLCTNAKDDLKSDCEKKSVENNIIEVSSLGNKEMEKNSAKECATTKGGNTKENKKPKLTIQKIRWKIFDLKWIPCLL